MDEPSEYQTLDRLAVERFLAVARTDRHVAAYFAGTDLDRVGRHLRRLLNGVLTGEVRSCPEQLMRLHQRLGLTEEAFDRFGHYLLTTLLTMRVGPEVLAGVGGFLAQTRSAMLHPSEDQSGPQGRADTEVLLKRSLVAQEQAREIADESRDLRARAKALRAARRRHRDQPL